MKAKRKLIIIGIVSAGLVCALAAAGYYFIGSGSSTAVDVYSMSSIGMEDYFSYDTTGYEGVVAADDIQTVYLSDTLSVTDILVSEGQTVSVGDALMTYDTTLSELEIKSKDLEIQRMELELEDKKAQLKEYQSYEPGEATNSSDSEEPEDALGFLDDDDEEDSGVMYMSAKKTVKVTKLSSTDSEAEEPSKKVSEMTLEEIKAQIKELKAVVSELNTQIETAKSFGQDTTTLENEVSALQYQIELLKYIRDLKKQLDGDTDETEDIADSEEDLDGDIGTDGEIYTAAELEKLISEKQQEIKDAEIEIKLAKVEYQRMEAEFDDGTVYSTVDGTVVSLSDEESARADGAPIMVVSGGGGFLIDTTVSELQAESISVGDSVSVYSYDVGEYMDGVVYSIGDMPATNDDMYYYSGNSNVSYYPMVVQVDETANLGADTYVEITFDSQQEEDGDSVYIEKEFVRSENGKSYCMVAGEDGKLEKRYVTKGTTTDNYIEIKSGLSMEDMVAFPYGNDVKEGANTQEGEIEDFWASLYDY